MPTKPRVCQVLHGVVGGGSEQVVLNYAGQMLQDFDFDMIYQYQANEDILKRFESLGFKSMQIPGKIRRPFSHLWSLYRLLKKGNYSVVHSHLDWYLNFYVLAIARFCGVKVRVAHHHQNYRPQNRWLLFLQFFLQKLNCVFATSLLACGEEAAISGYGKKAYLRAKVLVLNNAIDPQRFAFDENQRLGIRKALKIPENSLCIGHVGRFYPEKNHKFLIEAFSRFHSQNPDSVLLLLGEGPLQKSIQQQVQSLDIQSSVIFAGLQKDTAPYYSAMDCFCLPSKREALPLVLVEAQYNALPVFISDVVTKELKITDTLQHLPIDNPSVWSQELSQVKVRKTAKLKINSKKFDIHHTYPDLKNIYQEP